MKIVIALATLFAAGWGLAAGGLFGALTGFIATLGIGSGLQMFLVGTTASDTPEPRLHPTQRISGLVCALFGCLGAYYGGWRMGWLYALGGYLVGMAVGFVLSFIAAPKPQ